MSFSSLPLSYCANVHPSNTFEEMRRSLDRYTRRLAERLGQPLGAGLWLNRSSLADVVADPIRPTDLACWLTDHGLVTYTLNAFPFGDFHAQRVKEQVYQPDWSEPARLEYTQQAADLLARLLPEGAEGSISTVPCALKALHPPGTSWDRYFPQLAAMATYLAHLCERRGRNIRLAIEPEPCCVLETIDEAIRFFRDLRSSVTDSKTLDAVRTHLGLCFDVCHQAVEFEDVSASIARLTEEGIRINKVHITCALELRDPERIENREYSEQFVEERYLHQTFAVHPDGRKLSASDFTLDLVRSPPPDWLQCAAWRVHFHVPVNEDRLGPLFTTRRAVTEALRQVGQLPYAPHLEVETYTWNVMPTTACAATRFDLVEGLYLELTATQALIAGLVQGSSR
jgi:hypothetical protein